MSNPQSETDTLSFSDFIKIVLFGIGFISFSALVDPSRGYDRSYDNGAYDQYDSSYDYDYDYDDYEALEDHNRAVRSMRHNP